MTDASTDRGEGVQLRLLCTPSARIGATLRPLTRKPMAMAAFLAVSGEHVRRDTLATLLWPETASGQAATNVRKAIWVLRRTLGPGTIDSRAGLRTIRVSPDVATDVAAFRRLLVACAEHGQDVHEVCGECASSLREAVSIYGAGFMAGFGLSDSVEFDQWQALHAERLRQEMLVALDRLIRFDVAAGELEQATVLARRQLEVDSLYERGHRHLIRLLAWTGNRSEALRQAERCRQLLQESLELPPEPATEALRTSIVAQRLAPPTASEPIQALISSAPALKHHPLRHIDVHPVSTARSSQATAKPEDAPRRLRASRARLLAGLLDDRAEVALSAEQLREIMDASPADLAGFHIARLARWAHPRYRLDQRFVSLSLLLDRGETSAMGRWLSRETRFRGLTEALAEISEPIVALLGAPGSGKTTLLRRLELDCALAALRREARSVPFLLELSAFPPDEPGEASTDPIAWVLGQWRARYPDLPPLETLMDQGRALLLLDGLNEIPHRTASQYYAIVGRWKTFAHELVQCHPGNRLIFACRSLDYSSPLSSPGLTVPQLRVEPLTDASIRAFLDVHVPDRADALWTAILESGHLDVYRVPFFLHLLTQEGEGGDPRPIAPAELLSAFVRQALLREVERDHPSLAPGVLFGVRDRLRLHQARGWPTPHSLPEEGTLISQLVNLAYQMQRQLDSREGARVRLPRERACALLDAAAESVLRVGLDLSVLEEDLSANEIMFAHQLLQEYFAARRLAERPEPGRARREHRADRVQPCLEDLLPTLAPSDRMPPLPRSRWEETTKLAAAMTPDLVSFLLGLAETNLALAGHCAVPALQDDRLDEATADVLRARLHERMTDREADLRDREECGLALGLLGDPRFPTKEGPLGTYIEPPLVTVPAGRYRIGRPESAFGPECGEQPYGVEHEIDLDEFALGRFAITNAEWCLFRDSEHFMDLRWWDTLEAAAWIAGEGFLRWEKRAARRSIRGMRRLLAQRDLTVEQLHESGELLLSGVEYWNARLSLTEAEDDAWLDKHLGSPLDARETRSHREFNNPSLPVVDVCWHEARAYCAWLSAQTGRAYRLPNEAEWEAAARGAEDGRRYAFGEEFDPLSCNGAPLRLHHPTPVGLFPEGDSPFGASDLTGNTGDWTASLWGPKLGSAAFDYPYDATDGREDPEAGGEVMRVIRGGWYFDPPTRLAADRRVVAGPHERSRLFGFRVACSDR